MKSIQWSFRALVVLIAVTSVACGNKGGSKGKGGARRKGSSQQAFDQNKQMTPEQRLQAQKAAEAEEARLAAERANRVGTPVPLKEEGAVAGGAPAYAARTSDRGAVAAAPTAATSVVAVSEPIVSPRRVSEYARTEDLVLRNQSGQSVTISTLSNDVSSSRTYIQSSDIVRGRGTVGNGGSDSGTGYYARTEDVRGGSDTRAGNEGPGWPKDYSPSQQPLYSGMVDERGQAYTDAKDDSIMAVMVDKMNRMAQELRVDSEQMAMAVNQINLAVDRQIISLNLVLRFADREINEDFSGYLTGQNRTAQLQQRSSRSGEQFVIQATCVDRDTNCRNVILKIDQIREGQVCRTVYAVHRWMMDGVGDGHFTLAREEYNKSSQIFLEDKAIQKAQKEGKKYDKELIVKNRAERAFLRVVGNTIHYNRMMNGESHRELSRTPRLGFLGVRSWAVAYGPSFFEITMGKAKAGAGGRLSDSTRFAGLLTKPRVAGEVAETMSIEGEYSNPQIDERYDDQFAKSITKAQLVDNDGRGNLTLQVQFKDSSSLSRVNFTGLRIPALSGAELQQVVP